MKRLEIVFNCVSEASGFSPEQLKSRSRNGELTLARAAFAYFARKKGIPFVKIGKMIGRDHATVISADRRFRCLLAARDEEAEDLNEGVMKVLNNNVNI